MTAWIVTLLLLGLMLALDFALAFRNRNIETSLRAALGWTFFYLATAIAFGISLGIWSTQQARQEFFAGWITEYSLSFDNLFIYILILARLKVAKEKEELVLLTGIGTSLFLRAIFIAGGAALVDRWSWVFFVFGGFLIYTAISLFKESEEEEWQEGRYIQWLRKRGTKTFTLALTAIAITNVLFAFDSIPAIFGLTTNTYVIVTANVFALMGLRQLYFVIGNLMKKLVYLTEGLSILLAFIGVKLLFEAGRSQGWHHIPDISLGVSLVVILGVLAATTALSLYKSRSR